MSRARTSTPEFLAETQLIPIRDLHPNSWNVNHLNAFQYAKLLESIQEFGFLDPVLARPCPVHADFEIVGGEHRWRGAGDLGYRELPTIVKQMTDPVARRLSIIDNELHGQSDPTELSALLRDLNNDVGTDELLVGLPYTPEILTGFLDLDSLSPLPDAPPPASLPSPTAERWVERTYRMPASVADVLDDALARAREQLKEDAKDFEALEILAAEFLAS